jgi:hypothetical protein
MKNNVNIVKWVSLIIFIVGFCVYQNYLPISQISFSSSFWMMIAAMGLVLFFSRSVGWLGFIFFALGAALLQEWIHINLGQFTFSGIWLMAGGFLTTWLSAR